MEEKTSLICPERINQPEMRLERLIELSTMSDRSTELLARDGEGYEILMKNESVNETRRESMSMHPQPIPAIPEETVRIAHAVLPKGNMWMQMRDELGTLYEDHDFQDLFLSRGQPAEAPWRLALVAIMQYGEGRTDRQAAVAVRTRIDGK